MAKQAPAVARALRILAQLAARPDEALTLSELARAAEVNLSTCHAIVTSLSEASYLLRHEPLKTCPGRGRDGSPSAISGAAAGPGGGRAAGAAV